MFSFKNKALKREMKDILKSLEDEISKIKVEKSKMEVEESRIRRELDECRKETKKIQSYIQSAKDDEDINIFLSKRESLEIKEQVLKNAYDEILHDFISQMNELNARKNTIDIKIERAKIQEKINELNSGLLSGIEEKANRLLDEAEAMAELNQLEKR